MSSLRAARALRTSFWGFADQALISGVNFITMVLLARQLGPATFGAFVLAYTVLMFANSIQGALFTQPHNVLGAPRTGDDYARYTTATALAQAAFSLAAGLLVALAGVALVVLGRDHGPLLLAVALAIVTWQLQEFLRRVFYTQGDYRAAFTNDLVTYGGQLAAIALLWRLDRLTATNAVLAIAIAALAGGVAGAWRLREVLGARLDRTTLRRDLTENWVFGRWLLGSALTSWISGQLYPLLTAGFVGVASTGAMRATQNVVAPTHILLKGLDAMIPARASRVYDAAGAGGLRAYARRFALPAGGLMATYCAVVFVAAGPIVGLLLGEQYEAYAWLVRIYAVSYLLVFASTIASIILRAAGQSAPMFRAYLISAALVLTVGVWAVATFGLEGAMVGVILHGLVVNAALWLSIRATLSSPEVGEPR